MRKDFFKKKYKSILIGIFVVALMAMVVGISYAAYVFTGTGTKENVITTGQIVVNFNETNNIRLTNRYAETDEQGLANPDSNSTLEFSVSSDIIGQATVNYAIGLVEINEGATLKEDYIKIYMTKNGTVANGFTENKGNLISSYKNKSIEGYLDSHVITQDSLTGVQTNNYVVKAWIDENYDLPITDSSNGTSHSNQTTSETFSFKIKVVATDSNLVVKEPNTNGANAPELATNMIPVYYDETNEVWKKADSSNSNSSYKWYDYNSKMWANAVTVSETNRDTYLNASLGTEISMDDINTMWVWIPRFSATGDTANYNGGTKSAPGAFDITFVDNKTSAHDAFTFGTQNLNGFWVGKFETSHNTLSSSITENNLGCTSDTCSNANGIIIKPNVKSLSNNDVSNFFYASLSMSQTGNSFGFDKTKDTTLDTHMMKNNEWGAVAYLTQSIYGRCTSSTSCTEVGINNSSSYITGYGAPAGSSKSVTNGTYNTDLGKDASTTGNIYGVYDMSGGAYEYVMGVYTDGTQNWSGYSSTDNSGFSGCLGRDCSSTYDGVAYPDSKYYNSYTTSTNYTNSNLQHALTETKNWYSDSANFVNSSYPWFLRGGYYSQSTSAGVFYFNSTIGNAIRSYSVRLVITNE